MLQQLVTTLPGVINYLVVDLPFALAVAGVFVHLLWQFLLLLLSWLLPQFFPNPKRSVICSSERTNRKQLHP